MRATPRIMGEALSLFVMSTTGRPAANDATLVTGNTARTAPENRNFYPALDGLRAIAFLMVFGQHYLHIPWGWTGVDLFFVLSGFLITGILFDSRNDAYRVRNFYIRRTLRIFPLYYGIMLAMLAAEPLMHWDWSWKWLIWPAYMGNYARFMHPYSAESTLQRLADFQPVGHLAGRNLVFFLGHFWSLCVEEQFYLVWPWIMFWIGDRRKLSWICAATVPACLAMRLAGQHLLPTWMLDNEILYRATPFRLDALLMGGLIALILRSSNRDLLLRIARMAFPVAIAVGLAWIVLFPSGHLWTRNYVDPTWKFTWGLFAVDIFSGLLILGALQPGTVVHTVLQIRWLRWLGRISYGAYVWHDIFHPELLWGGRKIILLFEPGHHYAPTAMPPHTTIVVACIALLFTVSIAWLSFRFFESPFLNLKERWTIRPAG